MNFDTSQVSWSQRVHNWPNAAALARLTADYHLPLGENEEGGSFSVSYNPSAWPGPTNRIVP